jgi:hypothetical protein
MKLVMVLAAAAALLSGCANESGARMGLISATAPVIAMLRDDLFTGIAVGYMDQTGTIDVVSSLNPSLKCIGNFQYIGTKIGRGDLRCNDGTRGDFQFNGLSPLSGYGFGSTERGPLSFTFGLTPAEAMQYLKLPPGKTIKKDAAGRAQALVAI